MGGMSDPLTISIDAMGGDHGPRVVVDAMARAARSREDIRYILHGRADALEPLVDRRRGLEGRCRVVDAPDVVAMDEKPSRALRRGRGSSMWSALQSVARGEARVAISPGNTGALMAMAVLVLRKAPAINRPAIAVLWPADRKARFNIVLDVGADLRAEPRNLLEYGVMGAEYARHALGHDRPRIGLLNIGTEKTKGPPELAEADALLAAHAAAWPDELEYLGFVEGNDIPTDRVDVVVTDGFTGNIALKTGEGTASFIRATLKQAFRFSILSRIGALFALTSLQRMNKRIDPRRVNGGVFLGLNGTVVKSHGAADATGFASAIGLAFDMAKRDFHTTLAAQVAKLDREHETGPPESGAVRSGA